jgi:hypothetical protein
MSRGAIIEKVHTFIKNIEVAVIKDLPLKILVPNYTTREIKVIHVDQSADKVSRLLYIANIVLNLLKSKCDRKHITFIA